MTRGNLQELAAQLRALADATVDEIRVVGDEVVLSLAAAEVVAAKLEDAERDASAMTEKLEALADIRARIQRRLTALRSRSA